MPEGRRARPQPTPETQHFWDGTRAGELRLQRCNACAQGLFPAAAVLPRLRRRARSASSPRSGKGRLYSYVIHHRPVPGFTPPYAIAVVELDEGPRMMTNIVDCPQTPEALVLDMPLEVAFEKLDDEITLPLFRPAERLSAMKPKSIRHRRRRRDHRAGPHPRHVADRLACRRRAQRDGGCRPQPEGHRRHRHRRRDAGDDRALPRHHAEMGRRHRGRRLLVHDPCPPRRRGDRLAGCARPC